MTEKEKYIRVFSIPFTNIFILRFFKGKKLRFYFARVKKIKVWTLVIGRIVIINDKGLKALILNG